MKRALKFCVLLPHSGCDLFLESFLLLSLNQILPEAEIMVVWYFLSVNGVSILILHIAAVSRWSFTCMRIACHWQDLNALRTGDAELRFYITTVQDG